MLVNVLQSGLRDENCNIESKEIEGPLILNGDLGTVQLTNYKSLRNAFAITACAVPYRFWSVLQRDAGTIPARGSSHRPCIGKFTTRPVTPGLKGLFVDRCPEPSSSIGRQVLRHATARLLHVDCNLHLPRSVQPENIEGANPTWKREYNDIYTELDS